jgi:pimeloyl-ACP methyl ester carboxylesterase
VVLLHGVGTTSRYFRPLLRALDGRVTATAPELPGIGSSSRGRLPEDVADQAAVVAGWLRATRRHPAVLVGNSMGTQTAVEVAALEPELVDGLVLLGPTVDASARTVCRQIGRLLVDAMRERPSMLLVAASDTFLTQRAAVVRNFRASLSHRIEERIRHVAVPTLVVRGSADPVAPRRWAEQVLATVPRGRLVEVPRAAHARHHGRPSFVADLLVQAAAERGGVVRPCRHR